MNFTSGELLDQGEHSADDHRGCLGCVILWTWLLMFLAPVALLAIGLLKLWRSS